MPRFDWNSVGRHRGLVAVTAIQAGIAVYFVTDVLGELPEMRTQPLHPVIESLAVLGLVIGTVLGARQLWRALERNDRMESRLRAASGAVLDLLEESFQRWSLTPSERDVALLSIKGLSIADIAQLRATRVGTVKAQCAAVYRKAGVNGRAQLLSHFVEDLMSGLNLESASARALTEPDRDPRAAL